MSRKVKWCSFCGKKDDEVERLEQGPGVAICNECVEIICEVMKKPPAPMKTFTEFKAEALRRAHSQGEG